MKSIFRYITLCLSSLGLAVLGVLTLPDNNVLSDIFAEIPAYKAVMIAVIFFGYLVVYWITTLIVSFVWCLFFKIATKEKEQFNQQQAEKYSKSGITLLIALHVLCFAVQLVTNNVVYVAMYTAIGFLITYCFTDQYKKKQDGMFNMFVALAPQFVYVIGSGVYTFLNL